MPAELLAAERFGWQLRNLRGLQTLTTGDPQPIEALVTSLQSAAPTAESLAMAIRDVPGHFAAIIKGTAFCCAIVDHCRSSPIFYTDATVSNDAHLIRIKEGLDTPNQDAVTDAAMAGFVTGGDTLFQGLRQLEAGSLVIWRSGSSAPVVTSYRSYMPGLINQSSESILIDEFLTVLDGAIERTIARAAGRPLWVPLSGGRDSRILLAKFVEQGYDNLFAFTYGPKNNDEMRAAKIITDHLRVPWKFVHSQPAIMRQFFNSPKRDAYWAYCDGLSAVPNFQDLLTLQQFEAEGSLPEDAIIVNGQTGDFISGGHIPAKLMQSAPSPDSLFEAIVDKHFSLWDSLKTPERLERIRERVFNQLDITPHKILDRDMAIAHYEQFEFNERQSKYVVNGQRNYEFLGRDWSLPLWDGALVEFWRNVPMEQKYGQKLFRTALEQWNYGGLFREFEPKVDQWSGLTKAVLIPSRLIRLTLGPAQRDTFLRHMLYFGMYQDQYAPFGYTQFLKSANDLRNPVSLLSRAWLNERGLSATVD